MTGLAALAPAAQAAFPGINGRILFTSFRDGNGNLFSASPSTGAPAQRLTTDPGDEAQATWSPDGRRIAYRSNRDGNYDIYAMNAEGSGQTRITRFAPSRFAAQPAWAPDGRHILFRGNPDGSPELYVINADGTNVRRLTTNSTDERYPVYSPDGARIAFVSDRDGDSEIFTMDPSGGSVVQLTRNNGLDTAPAWSPDSTRIVFRTTRDGNSELYSMAADGSGQTRLTTSPYDEEEPDWSPDGTRILFTTNRDAKDSEVYSMNTDGTAWTRLTVSAGRDLFPDWQPLASPVGIPKPPVITDHRAPRMRVLASQRRPLLRGRFLIVRARCDEYCKLRASARVQAVGRTIARGAATRSLPPGKLRVVKIRLSALEVRSIHRALRNGHRTRVRLKTRALDRTGNASSLRRTLFLQR